MAPHALHLTMAGPCSQMQARLTSRRCSPAAPDFAAQVEPRALFNSASRIRAVGLSLNLICQQLPDQHLRGMLTGGTQLTCLFLDPDGEAIKAREREEETPHLAT